VDVDLQLQSLGETLEAADRRVKSGSAPESTIWPTGFDILDEKLTGGFRSGDLVLLAGPQGLGKTTFALQVARNVARLGRPVVYVSYEHDQEAVLIRLVSFEAGLLGGVEAPTIDRIRQAFEATDGLGQGVAERLGDTASGAAAVDIVREYADRMHVYRGSGSKTGLAIIENTIAEVQERTGHVPLVILDYLQKIPVPQREMLDEERSSYVVERLKDMALDYDLPIMAIVASDKQGIETGRRMRVNNMRGSSALAYEADIVLILNEKYDVVARHHLVYDVGNVDRFRHWAVLTIEKNRNGRQGIDMEFQKRFDQGRFDMHGQLVAEQLVDERVFVE
jgi:replicative DNA helicase